ncbi:hypothetical protein V6N13_065410 [Hibiscus sabdariffa]|uniref:Uncharacterized protein n=1 Tax=Hibiscus sabdariffa TaxID=183260 RepID=A0ABR2QQW9_9ROSI
MQNPNTLRALTSGSSLAGAGNARPPDEVLIVDDMIMDRPRSPLLEDVQRQIKKRPKHRYLGSPLGEVEDSVAVAQENRDPRNPDELYGPWMQAPSKKRRLVAACQGVNSAPSKVKDLQRNGLRFSALSEVNVVEDLPDSGYSIKSSTWGVASGVLTGSHGRSLAPTESSKRTPSTAADKGKIATKIIWVVSSKSNVTERSIDKGQVGKPVVNLPVVASRDKVVQVAIILNMENHAVVHIENMKEGSRKGRKRDDKGGPNMAIANRVTSLLYDLDKAKAEANRPIGEINNPEENSDALIQ